MGSRVSSIKKMLVKCPCGWTGLEVTQPLPDWQPFGGSFVWEALEVLSGPGVHWTRVDPDKPLSPRVDPNAMIEFRHTVAADANPTYSWDCIKCYRKHSVKHERIAAYWREEQLRAERNGKQGSITLKPVVGLDL